MHNQYPPKREKERFRLLRKYKAIYDGRHHDIFNRDKSHLYIDNKKRKLLYIAVNLPAKISEYYSSLILGDGVFFDVDDNSIQEQINDITQRNDFEITLLEGSIDQSRYGYYMLRVRLQENEEGEEQSVIEQVPNDQFVVEFTHELKPRIRRLELFAFIKIQNETGVEEKFLFKEIYFYPNGKVEREEVRIERQLWTLDNTDSPKLRVPLSRLDPELEEEVATAINFIPVKIINNSKPSELNFGKSDYRDLQSLFEELNDKVSMVAKQLQKHMNSKIAVPQGTLDDMGNVIASEADIFEVGGGEITPQYITNSNPQIDQAFKHIENITRDIAAISQIPLQALGFDQKGGVESPEGFRLRNFETQKRIEKKRLYMESSLKFIINTCLIVEGQEVQKIEIVWSNILPEDFKLQTEVLALQVGSELKSKKKAIKELQELDEEQLEEEINQIEQERSIPSVSLNEVVLPSQEQVQSQTDTGINPLLENL